MSSTSIPEQLVGQPAERRRMEAELAAACARYGFRPGEGERVDGWVASVGVTGHDARGTEYRRVYLLSSSGATRGDVKRLLADGLQVVTDGA